MNRYQLASAAGALSLVVASCAPTGPHSDDSTLEELFAEAAAERAMPPQILEAVAYLQTGFEHADAPSAEGGVGLMHLISRDDFDPLAEGAAAIGASEDEVGRERRANVRAAAAVLAGYARAAAGDDDVDWSDWKVAVARYSGIADPKLAEAEAGQVFAVIRDGAAIDAPGGDRVIIEPIAEVEPEADWRAAFSADNPRAELVDDPVVGVALHYPETWEIERDPLLFSTHGFVIKSADLDPADPHDALPIARIARDYDATPAQLDDIVAAKRADYPDLEMSQSEVLVGDHRGIALGPIPGGQASINVYVATGEHVYRINYYGRELDERGLAMLEALILKAPTETVESRRLIPARSPQALFGELRADMPAALPLVRAADVLASAPAADGAAEPVAAAGEYRLSNGCWAQPTGLFIQIAHSWDANGSGWSRMGTPNFWGERTHGGWGMGRCTSGYYTNDLYAIDYYLRRGDRLYSPFAEGYVMYVGWDPENWWNYGKMVVIATPGGKFWSLSAHLSRVNVVPGQYVTDETLIGWAGSTGYAAPYPHLHQVYYRWARSSWGRPYGGQGLKPTRLVHLGQGGGAYRSFWKGKWASW